MTSDSSTSSASSGWPALPLAAWVDTYATLHMWTQIVGKTRRALAPMENHWWQIPLYVTPRGLTTSIIPCGRRAFAVDFDFIDHALLIKADNGASRAIALVPRSVADFYAEYLAALAALGFAVKISGSPNEVAVAIPFAKDTAHAAYDAEAAHTCWRILLATDRVMKRFRGRFAGKASPAHFFWGSFDLATTRFSGRPAPRHPGGAPNCPNSVMVEAYSHECSSCGFWPGGGAISAPAFYAYAYPQPAGYGECAVSPGGAFYSRDAQEFLLPYDSIRELADPDQALLQFFQSTYEAAANCGNWDRAALDREPAVWP